MGSRPVKIKCPECDTTYDVSKEIATSGTQVQCAKCAGIFTATPLSETPPPALPEAPITPRPEAGTESAQEEADSQPPAEEAPANKASPQTPEGSEQPVFEAEPKNEPDQPVDTEEGHENPERDSAPLPAATHAAAEEEEESEDESLIDLDIGFAPITETDKDKNKDKAADSGQAEPGSAESKMPREALSDENSPLDQDNADSSANAAETSEEELDIGFAPIASSETEENTKEQAEPEETEKEKEKEKEKEADQDIAFVPASDENDASAKAGEEAGEALLTEEEKEFFASFGERLAKEEETASSSAQTVSETQEEPAAEEEDDIGFADIATEEAPTAKEPATEPSTTQVDFDPVEEDEALFADPELPESAPSPAPLASASTSASASASPTAPPPNQPASLRTSHKLMMGWGALVTALVLLVSGAVFFRNPVVRMLPGMAGLYEAAGLSVNIRGLEFFGLSHQWMNEQGRMKLVVRGEISNITNKVQPVPEIVFAMLDGSGREFFQWSEPAPMKRLNPHMKMRFRAQIPAPADRVHQVKIRFAKN